MLCRFLAALRNAIRAFRVMWEAQSTTPSHHGGTERSNAVKRGSAVGGSHAAPWEKPRPEKYSGSRTPNQSSVEAAPGGSPGNGTGLRYEGSIFGRFDVWIDVPAFDSLPRWQLRPQEGGPREVM